MEDEWAARQRLLDASISCLPLLKQAVECLICGHLQAAPALLRGCGHSFCGACLETALAIRQECPRCSNPATARDMQKGPVFLMQDLGAAYTRIKSAVEQQCQQIENDENVAHPPTASSSSSSSSSSGSGSGSSSSSSARKHATSDKGNGCSTSKPPLPLPPLASPPPQVATAATAISTVHRQHPAVATAVKIHRGRAARFLHTNLSQSSPEAEAGAADWGEDDASGDDEARGYEGHQQSEPSQQPMHSQQQQLVLHTKAKEKKQMPPPFPIQPSQPHESLKLPLMEPSQQPPILSQQPQLLFRLKEKKPRQRQRDSLDTDTNAHNEAVVKIAPASIGPTVEPGSLVSDERAPAEASSETHEAKEDSQAPRVHENDKQVNVASLDLPLTGAGLAALLDDAAALQLQHLDDFYAAPDPAQSQVPFKFTSPQPSFVPAPASSFVYDLPESEASTPLPPLDVSNHLNLINQFQEQEEQHQHEQHQQHQQMQAHEESQVRQQQQRRERDEQKQKMDVAEETGAAASAEAENGYGNGNGNGIGNGNGNGIGRAAENGHHFDDPDEDVVEPEGEEGEENVEREGPNAGEDEFYGDDGVNYSQYPASAYNDDSNEATPSGAAGARATRSGSGKTGSGRATRRAAQDPYFGLETLEYVPDTYCESPRLDGQCAALYGYESDREDEEIDGLEREEDSMRIVLDTQQVDAGHSTDAVLVHAPTPALLEAPVSSLNGRGGHDSLSLSRSASRGREDSETRKFARLDPHHDLGACEAAAMHDPLRSPASTPSQSTNAAAMNVPDKVAVQSSSPHSVNANARGSHSGSRCSTAVPSANSSKFASPMDYFPSTLLEDTLREDEVEDEDVGTPGLNDYADAVEVASAVAAPEEIKSLSVETSVEAPVKGLPLESVEVPGIDMNAPPSLVIPTSPASDSAPAAEVVIVPEIAAAPVMATLLQRPGAQDSDDSGSFNGDSGGSDGASNGDTSDSTATAVQELQRLRDDAFAAVAKMALGTTETLPRVSSKRKEAPQPEKEEEAEEVGEDAESPPPTPDLPARSSPFTSPHREASRPPRPAPRTASKVPPANEPACSSLVVIPEPLIVVSSCLSAESRQLLERCEEVGWVRINRSTHRAGAARPLAVSLLIMDSRAALGSASSSTSSNGDSSPALRSLKFYQAICAGVPVVSSAWLQACIVHGARLDHARYALTGGERRGLLSGLTFSLLRVRRRVRRSGYVPHGAGTKRPAEEEVDTEGEEDEEEDEEVGLPECPLVLVPAHPSGAPAGSITQGDVIWLIMQCGGRVSLDRGTGPRVAILSSDSYERQMEAERDAAERARERERARRKRERREKAESLRLKMFDQLTEMPLGCLDSQGGTGFSAIASRAAPEVRCNDMDEDDDDDDDDDDDEAVTKKEKTATLSTSTLIPLVLDLGNPSSSALPASKRVRTEHGWSTGAGAIGKGSFYVATGLRWLLDSLEEGRLLEESYYALFVKEV